MIRSIKDLEVYVLAYKLAMNIFQISKKFPLEEKYSLTDQIRRSSRSIAVNISEGWGKRIYELQFKRYLVDAIGSVEETKSWLNFATDCEYLNSAEFEVLYSDLDKIGSKIYRLYENWKS
jgi:four helix bundle protein